MFGKTFSNVMDCVQETLDCDVLYNVSTLFTVVPSEHFGSGVEGWTRDGSLCQLNGSLWVERLTRCEWGGLAVSLGLILVVSRVTGILVDPMLLVSTLLKVFKLCLSSPLPNLFFCCFEIGKTMLSGSEPCFPP